MPQTDWLDLYFDRIGFRGPVAPTLTVLRQLHALHPQAIPFENLAPYSGQPVSLALDDLVDKLLRRRRGGYCFEHNALFMEVLTRLGFAVTPLLARVRWQVPQMVQTGLTHMLLQVDLQGRGWFADVAFGSTTQTAPLAALPQVPQSTPHGRFRLMPEAAHWRLEFETAVGWQPVYCFGLTPAASVDREIGNWFTATHPQSVFRLDLLVSRTLPGARESMLNAVYTRRGNEGGLERFCYTEAAAWADCLRGRFGLDLPAQEAAALFDRALRRSQAAGASTLDGSPGAARPRAADTTSCRSG